MVRIETDLAKGSLDLVSRRDPEKVYHLLTRRGAGRRSIRISIGTFT